MLTAVSLSGSRSKGKGSATMTKSTPELPFDACNTGKVAHEMRETPQTQSAGVKWLVARRKSQVAGAAMATEGGALGALSDGYPSWRRLLDLDYVVGGLVSYARNKSEDQLARGFEGCCEGSRLF